MDGDVYARMISVIRGEHETEASQREGLQSGLGACPVRMRLGTVTNRVPLRVRVAGIEQPTQALRLNERLAKGAAWRMRLESPSGDYNALSGGLDGPVSCPGGSGAPQLAGVTGGSLHSADTRIDEGEATQLELDLEAGDEVLLLTEDDQVFYILMKVVQAV